MRKAINHLRQADPVLAAIISQVGPFRMPQRPADFWALSRSIVFQQLNGKAASTIWDRLEKAAGGQVTPDSVLALSEGQMRACGLSRQKLSYVRDLAARTASGEIDFAKMPEWSDEQVVEHLTRVKGIGEWTAQVFLMFALQRPNVLPTGDYGLRAAMKKAYRMRTLPKPKRMHAVAKPWHPYRSVACWYLWRSLDTKL